MLFDGDGMIIDQNDNWEDHPGVPDTDSALLPGSSLESMITRSLAPGAYTAIVSGAGGTTGIGIVEVFHSD